MQRITAAEFQKLLAYTHQYCVSMYLPTQQSSALAHNNEVLAKDLLDQARSQLQAAGIEPEEMEQISEYLDGIIVDQQFFQQRSQSYAVFLSPEFKLALPLPIDVEQCVEVSTRFYLKPVIRVVTRPLDFYLLAISQKSVQLYFGDRYDLVPIHLQDLPKDMASVVGVETGERQLQFHTGTTAPHGGGRPAMFHGSSSWQDDKQRYLERYLHAIEKVVEKHLRTQKTPLILAGVGYLLPMYYQINRYPYFIYDNLVQGNPETLSKHQMHQEALVITRKYLRNLEDEALEKYLEHKDANKVSSDVSEILREASMGRVDVLFVSQESREWGTFDPQTLETHYADSNGPTQHDLLDLACAQTLLNGGRAYVLPQDKVPTQSNVAALFRY